MTAWRLFPYPTLETNDLDSLVSIEDGSIIKAPDICRNCPTKECRFKGSVERQGPPEVHECRYGITNVRLDSRRLIVGVVATDAPNRTRRARSRAKKRPELKVTSGSLMKAVRSATSLGPGVVEDFEQSKNEILQRLKDSPEMLEALAKQLRTEFQENLSQSHDFLQLVKLVKGHVETLIQEKCPGMSTEDAAERLPTEGAIYFSTELMLLKMDALIFLHEINLVHGGERRFQIHPLLLKYCRIYRWQADQKDLNLQLSGTARSFCYYNPQAIGAVVQGLLDNMVKYAPAGSRATISVDSAGDDMVVEFSSLGPRIEPEEETKIFLPGYRAQAARGAASSGLGLGLATAKRISDALYLNLAVTQTPEEDYKYKDRFPTTFSIRIEST